MIYTEELNDTSDSRSTVPWMSRACQIRFKQKFLYQTKDFPILLPKVSEISFDKIISYQYFFKFLLGYKEGFKSVTARILVCWTHTI